MGIFGLAVRINTNMAATHKSKKHKKSSHRSHPYAESNGNNGTQRAVDDFRFNPALKTSIYTQPQSVETGKNPVFQFPIPPVDPIKANATNDEVDMYFPRKHFFRKFQTNYEFLDNILMKPIPVPKIVPPKLFPSPIVDGTLWETKRETLLKDIKGKVSVKENESELSDTQSKTSDTSKDKDEEMISVKSEDVVEAVEGEEKETCTNQDDGDNNDDNLSDYDPDFEKPTIVNKISLDKETRLVDAYINTRMQMKSASDFYIGSLDTMKLYQQAMNREVNKLEETINKHDNSISDQYKFNIDKIEKLHNGSTSYTASSIDEFEDVLNDVESERHSRYKLAYTEHKPFTIFKTDKFDSYRSEISLEDYKQRNQEKPRQISQDEKSEPVAEFQISTGSKQEDKPSATSNYEFDNNMLYAPEFGAVEEDDEAFGLSNEMFFN